MTASVSNFGMDTTRARFGPTILVDYQNLSGLVSQIPVDVLRKRVEEDVPQLQNDLEHLKEELCKSKESAVADIQAVRKQTTTELADVQDKSIKEHEKTKHDLERLEKAMENAVTELSDMNEHLALELGNTKHALASKARRSDKQAEIEDGGQNASDVGDEPGIAIENQLRIKEQSAKAIEIYMNISLSTVWIGCSKNTYGIE